MGAEKVSRVLGVGGVTVWRWCREGSLPCLKIGRRWRVRRSALEEFVRKSERSETLVAGLAAEAGAGHALGDYVALGGGPRPEPGDAAAGAVSQTGAGRQPGASGVEEGTHGRRSMLRETAEGKLGASEGRRRAGGFAGSSWWLVAKNGGGLLEPLIVGGGERRALAVFGFEEEATVFLRLGGLEGDGWRVRQSGAGELVSLLHGPCADAGSVALDPLPQMAVDGTLGLVSVGREDFLERLLDGGRPRLRRAADAKAGPEGKP